MLVHTFHYTRQKTRLYRLPPKTTTYIYIARSTYHYAHGGHTQVHCKKNPKKRQYIGKERNNKEVNKRKRKRNKQQDKKSKTKQNKKRKKEKEKREQRHTSRPQNLEESMESIINCTGGRTLFGGEVRAVLRYFVRVIKRLPNFKPMLGSSRPRLR